ncbi:MAG: hypothetical protein OXI60_06865 [Acidiferrobacterales bacterium]|nr:hypothetical protein [Acidiferrobacterales bacterium]
MLSISTCKLILSAEENILVMQAPECRVGVTGALEGASLLRLGAVPTSGRNRWRVAAR